MQQNNFDLLYATLMDPEQRGKKNQVPRKKMLGSLLNTSMILKYFQDKLKKGATIKVMQR
jgi:hypothetical protein